jgi:hypothetical protein
MSFAQRIKGIGTRFRTARELMGLLRQTGRWWLVPMVTIFFFAAGLLVAVQVIEYAAPFVYTIF